MMIKKNKQHKNPIGVPKEFYRSQHKQTLVGPRRQQRRSARATGPMIPDSDVNKLLFWVITCTISRLSYVQLA